jgi:hypothetical protein
VFLSEVANDRGDGYRAKALELHARAEVERSPLLKTEFESLAAAYLRLAEQAERNDALIVEFEFTLCGELEGHHFMFTVTA